MKILQMVLLILLTGVAAYPQQKMITVYGKTNLPPSSEMAIAGAFDDARFQAMITPIHTDGSFSISFPCEATVAMMLIKKEELDKGAYRPMYFFTDTDSIFFDLTTNPAIGQGDGLTDSYYQFIEALTLHITESQNELLENMTDVENQDSIQQVLKKNELKVIVNKFLDRSKKSPDILSYFLLIDFYPKPFIQNSMYSEDVLMALETLQSTYPNHEYSERLKYLAKDQEAITYGKNFSDISIKPSQSSSELIRLSTVVSQNKYTLLDLWAPWCGGCIEKSLQIKPHFDELKAMGFGIFSFMGGLKNPEIFDQTMSKFSYPWKVYKDLDQQVNIWMKYNIGNAGGAQFLIDQTGSIVAINPSLEEIKQYLEK